MGAGINALTPGGPGRPLAPAALALLGRLVRSFGPWRVAGVRGPDLTAMRQLVDAGLVVVDRGIFCVTASGRATAAAP